MRGANSAASADGSQMSVDVPGAAVPAPVAALLLAEHSIGPMPQLAQAGQVGVAVQAYQHGLPGRRGPAGR
jgi:hypothetical protein